ncbi:MAG TPA: hypothetical protein VM263_01495 [Acidimicrobiales bacterium]|jgi:hypothetical protein|nr:hypothetical protein [Acidimicrobiales bacterium]
MPRTVEGGAGAHHRARADLDHRLQARALVLALRPDVSADLAAESLVAMAGPTPAAPIAVRRALERLESAHGVRPNPLTGRAVEALALALGRVGAGRSRA